MQLHILTHVGSGAGGVQVCNFTSQLMWVVVVGVYKCATSHQTTEFFAHSETGLRAKYVNGYCVDIITD